MFEADDPTYYAGRAAEALRSAEKARTSTIAAIHRVMAVNYAERARSTPAVQAPPPTVER